MPRHTRLHMLSKTKIDTLPPGRHHDGGGLYLHIRGGARVWEFRYQRPEGARTWAGFGPYSRHHITEARAKAADWRALVKLGRDPALSSAPRPGDQTKTITRRGFTFKDMFRDFVAANRHQWRNAKNAAQWLSTMTEFVLPSIGDKDVADVTTSDIKAIMLQPIHREGGKGRG